MTRYLLFFNFILASFFFVNFDVIRADYEPYWDSLDSRPLPEWFDKAKVGIFLHWGVYAVPGFGSEWFWQNWKGGGDQYVDFMNKYYPPDFTYQEFAHDFTAELFDPYQWASLFEASGAKYVVLTSKHHEGFTLWPSAQAFSWNSVDIGPHRDIVGELSTAIRESTSLRFGVYYSLYEWFNPQWISDKESGFATSEYYESKVKPELEELVEKYKVEIIWSDGEWEAPDTYWHSQEFLAWLYNESPVKDTVVVNDRWGNGISCNHGGYFTCADRYNPGELQSRKWENAMTIDRYSWGFRREATLGDFLSPEELITTVVQTVSYGGNILVNVGPTKDGTIAPIFQERLRQLGTWLSNNGDAIYETQPWDIQVDSEDSDIYYTKKEDSVYAITLSWPSGNILTLQSANSIFGGSTKVELVENSATLEWWYSDAHVQIQFPDRSTVSGEWGFAIKITF